MEDRLAKIDKLVSKLHNNEVINENSEVVKQIRDKYKNLKNYSYRMASKIRVSDSVRCVSIDLERLSMPGVVVRINYDTTYEKRVKTLLLYSIYYKIFWMVSPKRVYIFVSNGANYTRGRDIADKILVDNIDYYMKTHGKKIE